MIEQKRTAPATTLLTPAEHAELVQMSTATMRSASTVLRLALIEWMERNRPVDLLDCPSCGHHPVLDGESCDQCLAIHPGMTA